MSAVQLKYTDLLANALNDTTTQPAPESRMAPSKIYQSSYPAPVVPTDESFWQFILRTNPHDAVPDKLIFQQLERRDQALTAASSRKLAGLGAQALGDVLGLTRRDSILLVAKNSIDWLLVDFAALWAGITIAYAPLSLGFWRAIYPLLTC